MKKIFITLIVIQVSINLYSQQTDTFKDTRDGTVYKTVKIGNQTWFAENLAFKVSSGCWAYDNDESKVSKYGYLYNWETAINVCPSGWHLPSDEEWKTLERNMGMTATEANEAGDRGDGIGTKLKSATGWELYRGNNYGNNESGFNALPAGYRNYSDGLFYYLGTGARFWSSTPIGSDSAWLRYLYYEHNEVSRLYYGRVSGFSVRCLKDN